MTPSAPFFGRESKRAHASQRRRLQVVRSVGAAVALAFTFSSCSFHNLSFVQDRRLEIEEPSSGATITLPLTVEWNVRDFNGSVLVLFDRSPMKPGGTLKSLAAEGDPCRTDPACPDAAWLAERDIYMTSDNRVVVESLPDRRVSSRSEDRHDVTIVLLDEDGRRISEAAFTREFVVRRGSSDQ